MSTYAAPTSAVSTSAVPSIPTPTHEIEISLDYLQASKGYSFPDMKVTETVRYFSKDGEVTIHLTGSSPFRHDEMTGTQVPGGVILTLVRSCDSPFRVGCSVTLPNGEVVGWPKLPSAGGEQNVGRTGPGR